MPRGPRPGRTLGPSHGILRISRSRIRVARLRKYAGAEGSGHRNIEEGQMRGQSKAKGCWAPPGVQRPRGCGELPRKYLKFKEHEMLNVRSLLSESAATIYPRLSCRLPRAPASPPAGRLGRGRKTKTPAPLGPQSHKRQMQKIRGRPVVGLCCRPPRRTVRAPDTQCKSVSFRHG